MSRGPRLLRAPSGIAWFVLGLVGAGTAMAQGRAGGAPTARFGEIQPAGSAAPPASSTTASTPEGAAVPTATPVATSEPPPAPGEPAAPAPAPFSPAEEPRPASHPPTRGDRHEAARREDEEEYQAWRRRKRRSWYGWQTLIADGASLTFMMAASGGSRKTDTDSVLASVGVLGYFFGAPSVHWAHENVGAGFGSLGIRGGSTTLLVLGAVSCYDGWGGNDGGDGCGFVIIGALGMLAAIPIDAAALAYEDVVPEEAFLGPLRRLRLSPVLGPVARPRRAPYADAVADAHRSTPLLYGGLVLHGEF